MESAGELSHDIPMTNLQKGQTLSETKLDKIIKIISIPGFSIVFLPFSGFGMSIIFHLPLVNG